MPTPAAPIMMAWTSPVSTRAMVAFLPSQPTTMPCAFGRFLPCRHSCGSKGTCRYVRRISLLVAHRAVPCCPWPTVLALMFRLYIPDNPAITARVPNMRPPARISCAIDSMKFHSFQFSTKLQAEKKKAAGISPCGKLARLLFLCWFSLIYQVAYLIFSFLLTLHMN